MHFPHGAEQADALGFQNIVVAAQHRRRQQSRGHHLQGVKFPAQCPGAVGHRQQHKAIEKAEPVGNHVGEMEAMPDIV